jgi:glycosyltransferase involved in cell wall biosynthesis
VGRFSPIKRPEWCLELAARCPQLSFDMVGASNIDSAYARSIAARAAGLPNVRLHGYVPYDRMGSFYAEAMLLLSTSLYEGFPNTFLEAWSYGRPVVGTVDPDGVVLASSLGAVAEDLDGLAKGLGDLLADRTRWLQASQAAYHYVIEHHSLEATVTAYEGVLAGLGAQNPA